MQTQPAFHSFLHIFGIGQTTVYRLYVKGSLGICSFAELELRVLWSASCNYTVGELVIISYSTGHTYLSWAQTDLFDCFFNDVFGLWLLKQPHSHNTGQMTLTVFPIVPANVLCHFKMQLWDVNPMFYLKIKCNVQCGPVGFLCTALHFVEFNASSGLVGWIHEGLILLGIIGLQHDEAKLALRGNCVNGLLGMNAANCRLVPADLCTTLLIFRSLSSSF